MPRFLHGPTLALVCCSCLLAAAVPVDATFSVTARDDDEILELVTELRGLVPPDPGSALVYLDRSTFLQAESNRYLLGQNHVMYATGAVHEDVATRTVDLWAGERVRSAGGWVVSADGSLRRLDDDDVRTDASENGNGEVVFAFPTLREGDTFALSITFESERPLLPGRLFLIDAEAPVLKGRFILQTDGEIGYSVQAFNVRRDDFTVKTGNEKHGNASRVLCSFGDLAADRDDPLGPPWRQRRAHILVNYKGTYLDDYDMWLTTRSWNRIGLGLQEVLADAVEPDKPVRKRAEAIVDGIDGPVARADALFRFVRDEIATLGLGESLAFRRAKDVLEARAGDTFDKAGLLVAMLRAVDVPANLGFARDRYDGPLSHRDPGFWQFTDGVVAVSNGYGDGWYTPGVDGCPPRVLPPHLRGVEVVFFGEDLEERSNELYRRSLAQFGGTERRMFVDYLERIRAADWTTVVETAGDPLEVVGSLRERRVLDFERRVEDVTVIARGIIDQGTWARQGTSGDEIARRHASWRGLDDTDIRDATVSIDDDEEMVECRWTGTVEAPVLAPDVWVLPAALVTGRPLFEFWKGGDRGPVYVRNAYEWALRTEIRLPAGWTVAEPVAPVDVMNPLFHYVRTVEVEADLLVVERSLRFRAGKLGEASLPMLDGDVQKIMAVETQNLVVAPVSTASGR